MKETDHYQYERQQAQANHTTRTPITLFFVTDNGGDGFPFVLGRFERTQRGAAGRTCTDNADAFGGRRGGHCFKCGTGGYSRSKVDYRQDFVVIFNLKSRQIPAGPKQGRSSRLLLAF